LIRRVVVTFSAALTTAIAMFVMGRRAAAPPTHASVCTGHLNDSIGCEG
jgi:hypothetical protein